MATIGDGLVRLIPYYHSFQLRHESMDMHGSLPDDCPSIPGMQSADQCRVIVPAVEQDMSWLSPLPDNQLCEILAILREAFDFYAVTGSLPQTLESDNPGKIIRNVCVA